MQNQFRLFANSCYDVFAVRATAASALQQSGPSRLRLWHLATDAPAMLRACNLAYSRPVRTGRGNHRALALMADGLRVGGSDGLELETTLIVEQVLRAHVSIRSHPCQAWV